MERSIPVADRDEIARLFGTYDRNLKEIRKSTGVDVIVRNGDKPENTFRGVIREKYANGDLKMEIEPGIFKTFGKDEIISMEAIPVR